jgi:hypothetical protein
MTGARIPQSILLLLACVLAGAACARSATQIEPDLVVAGGTSFGFCAGYCNTELIVDSTSVRLIESGRDPQTHPTKTRSLSITESEWERIRSLADPAVLTTVEGVHGCPDCADGGAEWVQVRTGADSIRATFEYGATLEPIAALQAEIRALRARFEELPR